MSDRPTGGAPFDVPYSEVIRRLREHEQSGRFPEIRIGLLRNITVDPIINYLRWFCYERKLRPEIYCNDFDNVMQDVLNTSSPLYQFKPQVIILCLHRDALLGRLLNDFPALTVSDIDVEVERVIEHCRAVVLALRQRCDAAILINNFENIVYPSFGVLDYQSPHRQVNTIRRLNDKLLGLSATYSGTYVVDVDLLQSAAGYAAFRDNRDWHMARAPYSREGAKLIAQEYTRFIGVLMGKAKKCLVLDCDGILWGGIVGEDGLDGIRLGSTYPGAAYVAFQRYIRDLHNRGVMLALCSKNREQDVLEVLERREEMLLKCDHFLVRKINWKDKASNLREIARELNVALDSMVFVDDSPFEINLVKRFLPEVETVELSGDPADFCDVLGRRGLFDRLTFSDEDRTRNQMYLADQDRTAAVTAQKYETIEDYYRDLEMEVSICDADASSLARVAQLTQKTNQFNLTTKRYSDADIRGFLADNDTRVRFVRVKDRFGDSGIVGVTILRYRGDECVIDSILLSCRVIGRGIEDCLLKDCELLALARGSGQLIGLYVATAKNEQVEPFYPAHGFLRLGTRIESQVFVLRLQKSTLTFPSYFKRIDRE